MPTFETDGWALDDAEARYAQAPDRFTIPSRHERETLRVGARVKLLFLLCSQEEDAPVVCERMWVTISAIDAGRYQGVLESRPVSSGVLAPGDRIDFGPEHVASVLIRLNGPRHPDYKPAGPG